LNSLSQNSVHVFKSEILLKLSPIERNSILFEGEFIGTLTAQEQVSETNAQFLIYFRTESVTSLAVIFNKVVSFLSKFWFNSGDCCVGVCTNIENLSSSDIIKSDFLLELSL
jgi:hypothetical protein